MNSAIKGMANLRVQKVDLNRRKKELFVSQNKEKRGGENGDFSVF
jgi:hypothetical protein